MSRLPKDFDAAKSLGIDLIGILEKTGHIQRRKQQTPGVGTARWNGKDDRTTEQLKNREWSGMRANDLWNRFEIWIFGNIEATLSYAEFFLRPEKLNELYCETFGVKEINLDAATQRDIAKLKERREILSEPELQRVISELEDPTIDARASTNPKKQH